MSDSVAQTIIEVAHHVSPKLVRLNGYLGRQEIKAAQDAVRHDPRRLEPYGYKVHSQADEDGILAEIFRRLNIVKGSVVEVGVQNGLESNSLYLIHQGWRARWVEGEPNYARRIREKFHDVLASARLELIESFVARDTFNGAIGGFASDLDFLSIDVDGMDFYFFQVMDIRPKVICIEYNAKFPPGISMVQTYNPDFIWAGGDYMGASLTAMWKLAQSKGYTLVGTNIVGSNAFFVRDDLVGDKFCLDSTPEYLYNPPRYWLVQDAYAIHGHPSDHGPYVHF